MKYIFALILCLLASTAFAHGSWKPCVTPPYPTIPYAYPQVVVPAQPALTLRTCVELPRVYYQWTHYYILQPVRPQRFVLFPRLHTTYVPTTQWVYQPYYSY
jgi:hypothetical protein